jgi:hypothetical protein
VAAPDPGAAAQSAGPNAIGFDPEAAVTGPVPEFPFESVDVPVEDVSVAESDRALVWLFASR